MNAFYYYYYCLSFVVGGLGFEFCVFGAGWRHALQSEWPFYYFIITASHSLSPSHTHARQLSRDVPGAVAVVAVASPPPLRVVAVARLACAVLSAASASQHLFIYFISGVPKILGIKWLPHFVPQWVH